MRQLNKKRVVGLAGAARIVYAVAGLPGFFQVRYIPMFLLFYFSELLLISPTMQRWAALFFLRVCFR